MQTLSSILRRNEAYHVHIAAFRAITEVIRKACTWPDTRRDLGQHVVKIVPQMIENGKNLQLQVCAPN